MRGLWAIAAPDDAAADRRLEVASGLPHRPLAVLTDRPAQGTTRRASRAVAGACRAAPSGRCAGCASACRVPAWPGATACALRAALVVALVAAFVIAGAGRPGSRLAAALQPTLPREPPPPATELQAWITPPAYTIWRRCSSSRRAAAGVGAGRLAPDGQRHRRRPARRACRWTARQQPFRALDKASFQADRDLTQGGRLAVRRNGRELAGWDLRVVADRPPTAAWTEPPGSAPGQPADPAALDGRTTTTAWSRCRPSCGCSDRPDAPPLVVSIPLPGGTPKAAHGVNQQDLTAHPWAGLPVIARLVARDAPGQTGTSDATRRSPCRSGRSRTRSRAR